MRKIPTKNYIIFGLLVIVTLTIVFSIRKTYLDKIDYENSTNETLNILSSVNEDELSTYLVENREIVLYMSPSGDSTIQEFENEFRNYILDNQLSQDIIYLNTRNISKSFIKNFKKNYFSDSLKSSDIEVVEQPNLYLIDNGKVVSVLYAKESKINMTDVKKFLETQEV